MNEPMLSAFRLTGADVDTFVRVHQTADGFGVRAFVDLNINVDCPLTFNPANGERTWTFDTADEAMAVALEATGWLHAVTPFNGRV
jgi:hypothetical protein